MKVKLVLVCLLLAIGAFQWSTVRSGHRWIGDYSQYFAHAANVVEGRPYDDIGYVRTQQLIDLAPATYPPLYPLLLVPVYMASGVDLIAAKRLAVIAMVLALGALFLGFRNSVRPAYLLTAIAACGFSPFFWRYKDDIGSDLTFLPVCFFTLWWVHRGYQRAGQGASPSVGSAIVTGILLYVGYGLRTLGGVLVPVVIAHDLLRMRRPSRFLLVALATFALCAAPQLVLLHSPDSYLDQFRPNDLAIITYNLSKYASLFENGYLPWATKVLAAVFLSLAVVGFLVRCRRGFTPFEVFVPLYVAASIIWSIYHNRYMLPTAPLLFAYAYFAIQAIGSTATGARWALGPVLGCVLTLALAASFAGKYSRLPFGPIEGIDGEPMRALSRYVEEETPPDSFLIFRFPRVLALETGRTFAALRGPAQTHETMQYFDDKGVDYLIVCHVAPNLDAGATPRLHDRERWQRILDDFPPRFEQSYANEWFTVYRIVPPGAE